MEFREAVRNIINSIPSGMIFDSHFVINQLIRNYSDEYLTFASGYANSPNMDRLTYRVHQQIGHVINSFKGDLIQRQPNDSWSENIHGNVNEVALWQKI